MLDKVVVNVTRLDETLVCDHSNESYCMRSTFKWYFIMLYKVVLTFKSMDETLVCDHSNDSY